MTDKSMKREWLDKRYNMKVSVDVVGNESLKRLGLAPLVVKEGDSSSGGPSPVEVSFDNINDISDIYITWPTEALELEKYDEENKRIVFYIYSTENQPEEFEIYYGRKEKNPSLDGLNKEAQESTDAIFGKDYEMLEMEQYEVPPVINITGAEQ